MKYVPRFSNEKLVWKSLSRYDERTVDRITAMAYPDFDPRLVEIRTGRVQAHLDQLVKAGLVTSREIWTNKGKKTVFKRKVGA